MPLITFMTDYTESSETSLAVGIRHSLHQVPLWYSVRPTVVVIEETLSVYLLVLLSHFFLAFYILPPSRQGLCNSRFTNKFSAVMKIIHRVYITTMYVITNYIYRLHIIVSINTDYLPNQHHPVHYCKDLSEGI